MTTRPRLHLALTERLDHLDVKAWGDLTQRSSPFMQASFLRALEGTLGEEVSPRYALLYDDAVAVAALALQIVRVRGQTAVAEHHHAVRGALRGVVDIVDERALVLGSLVGWQDTGLALRPGVEPASVWPQVLALLDQLRRFEKSEGLINVAAVKDPGPTTPEVETLLRRHGYQRAPSGADMVLRLDPAWASLDDYLAGLTANARRAVRKTLGALETGDFRLKRLSAEEVAAQASRLESLYGQVWANAEVRPVRLTGGFFARLKAHLGPACEVTAIERDGQTVAFGVALRQGDAAVGYYLGYDKALDAPLYLRLLVCMVEQAITWRVREVSMGRTSEEPKARLGAVPGPSSLWVKHRVPPLNWAMGAVLGSLEEPQVKAHRVFRQDA